MIVIAIILGAFGAHALKDRVEPAQLQSFEVGVRYQMYHGIALLSIGLSNHLIPFSLRVYNSLIIIGVVLFSVSIYFLSIQDVLGLKLSFLGPVTPIGGLMLISAWIVFLIKIVRSKNANNLRS